MAIERHLRDGTYVCLPSTLICLVVTADGDDEIQSIRIIPDVGTCPGPKEDAAHVHEGVCPNGRRGWIQSADNLNNLRTLDASYPVHVQSAAISHCVDFWHARSSLLFHDLSGAVGGPPH